MPSGSAYRAPSPQAVNLAALNPAVSLPEASLGPACAHPRGPASALPRPCADRDLLGLRPSPHRGWCAATRSSTAAVVSGDVARCFRLEQYGLSDRAFILARDADPAGLPSEWIVTDGNRRRYVSFGLNRANGSYVLTPTEGGPNGLPLERGVPRRDRRRAADDRPLHRGGGGDRIVVRVAARAPTRGRPWPGRGRRSRDGMGVGVPADRRG